LTSPAPPVPQRLTPRPPLWRRARRIAGITGALLIALAIVAGIWWTGIRDPPPGPLTNDISESIGIKRHPETVWTYGNPIAWNTGDEPVVLTRVWLVDPTPGLRVLETRVAGPGRKALSIASDPKWPADDLTDLHPVKGFQVAPQGQPDGDRGVEFVFALSAERPGRFTAPAVGVDYTVDGDEHRLYLSYGLGVCVTAASEPLARGCQPPKTLTAAEIED
jgi:hypothetical protein